MATISFWGTLNLLAMEKFQDVQDATNERAGTSSPATCWRTIGRVCFRILVVDRVARLASDEKFFCPAIIALGYGRFVHVGFTNWRIEVRSIDVLMMR
jgi:hypothetical protein